ncbi:MAG TPA: efflux RND transporter periplasmic adaptor subunit, partial [Devosia sp.]|nr:efflux RND transporter periplasmic adaptor subunit [Devosia sp.]
MKLFVRLLIVVVIVGGLGAAAWWHFAAPEAATEPTTIAVKRGTIEQTVLASGVLQAASLVSIGAEVSGRIDSVAVVLGQTVKKGDLIAQIDSLNQENAVKAAQAALAGIEAQKRAQQATLVQTKAALARTTQMLQRSLVAQTDFDTAQAAVDSGEAQIDGLDAQIAQSNLQVESAQLNLSRTKIVAPSDGTVVALLVDAGQTVNANSATPTIAEIANMDTMVIKAEISEADVVRVAAGQRVYFTILGEPDVQIDATLRAIEPAPTSINSDSTATDTAIYYNGLFDVPNPDHKLRISMTAQVTIVLDEAQNALVLPSGLLTRKDRDGNPIVQVYDPKTQARSPRPVKIGLDNNVMAQITDGLSEGDLVVQSNAPAAARTASTGGRGGFGGPGGGVFGGR